MSTGILNALDTLEESQESFQYGRHRGIKVTIQALEYHYQRYMSVYTSDDYAWHHETTAYLNRLGQLFYYFRSMKVDTTFKGMPSFANATRYRMKYSAHRQVDAPREGDYLADFAGSGITRIIPIRPMQAFERSRRALFYPGLTIPAGTGDDLSNASFFLALEHPYIMGEIIRAVSGLSQSDCNRRASR